MPRSWDGVAGAMNRAVGPLSSWNGLLGRCPRLVWIAPVALGGGGALQRVHPPGRLHGCADPHRHEMGMRGTSTPESSRSRGSPSVARARVDQGAVLRRRNESNPRLPISTQVPPALLASGMAAAVMSRSWNPLSTGYDGGVRILLAGPASKSAWVPPPTRRTRPVRSSLPGVMEGMGGQRAKGPSNTSLGHRPRTPMTADWRAEGPIDPVCVTSRASILGRD